MIIEYYEKYHLNRLRRYVKGKMNAMWYLKLTKHATITDEDFRALDKLGATLSKVEPPKGVK